MKSGRIVTARKNDEKPLEISKKTLALKQIVWYYVVVPENATKREIARRQDTPESVF